VPDTSESDTFRWIQYNAADDSVIFLGSCLGIKKLLATGLFSNVVSPFITEII
jgi:hypothetical protein